MAASQLACWLCCFGKMPDSESKYSNSRWRLALGLWQNVGRERGPALCYGEGLADPLRGAKKTGRNQTQPRSCGASEEDYSTWKVKCWNCPEEASPAAQFEHLCCWHTLPLAELIIISALINAILILCSHLAFHYLSILIMVLWNSIYGKSCENILHLSRVKTPHNSFLTWFLMLETLH